MRMEIQVQRTKSNSDYDWEAMGIKPPKGETFFRRLTIDTYDLEFIEEYNKKLTLLKCAWMESAVLVAGYYDDLLIQINDLENAHLEDEELGE